MQIHRHTSFYLIIADVSATAADFFRNDCLPDVAAADSKQDRCVEVYRTSRLGFGSSTCFVLY